MGKKNRSKYLEEAYDDFSNYRIGSPRPSYLDSNNMDLTNSESDLSSIRFGEPSETYLEDHAMDETEMPILSTNIHDQPNQAYIDKHNLEFDLGDETNIHQLKSEIQPAADKKKFANEEGAASQKIPLDFYVKKYFTDIHQVKCCGNSLFLYNIDFGCFEEKSESQLYVEIRKCLPVELDMKIGKNKMIEIVHRIMSSPELQVKHEKFDSHARLINLKDCVLDVRDGSTLPHSPVYLFTSYIDAEYEIKQSSGKKNQSSKPEGYYFRKFLEDCTLGDQRKMQSLQQVTGYIVSNEWRAKKFFILLGLPHSGKSVWLSLWRSLIGENFTTAMSLKQLGETRFMTAELFHSKLNISAEMDESGSLKATDVLKALTGGDLITGEKKGKDPFQFYGKTKLAACGNYMPTISKLDGTSALTDRMLFLIFSKSISEGNRDKNLLEKLILEKNYIIRWAIEGFVKLLENNLVFTESDDAIKFKLQYINDLNNVPEFVRDRCVLDKYDQDIKVHRKRLYPAYVAFCKSNGMKAISKKEFFFEVVKLGVKYDKFRLNKSLPLWGYSGIRLKTESELNNILEE